jgi:hypothetical protein
MGGRVSFLSGREWWTATEAAYALHQGGKVKAAKGAVVIDGRRVPAYDPRGVVSEARRMAGVK